MAGKLALVRGAGDVATAVALRLWSEGFRVVCTELPQPRAIRRTVAFAEAVYEGHWEVEGAKAKYARSLEEAIALTEQGVVAVLAAEKVLDLRPEILVDGRMAKANLDTRKDEAQLVIGLGPGFTAGIDCHAAVETLNGPDLGCVYLSGSPKAPTHVPCSIEGLASERVLRAPTEATFLGFRRIGDPVEKGEIVARMGKISLFAPCSGVIRGILRSGIVVPKGTKVVELDPRGDPAVCFRIADRSWRIAAGVISALRELGI